MQGFPYNRNAANWEDAINNGYESTLKTNRDFASGGIYVSRPDGSIVWVKYYSRGEYFRVRRIRCNGELGSSKYYRAEENGWESALNHRLPSKFMED